MGGALKVPEVLNSIGVIRYYIDHGQILNCQFRRFIKVLMDKLYSVFCLGKIF